MKTVSSSENIITRIWYSTIAMSIVLFIGYAEAPITHRKGLCLVPKSELLSLSLRQYDQTLKKSKLSTDHEKVKMVRRVGKELQDQQKRFFRSPVRTSRSKIINGNLT